MAFPRSVKQLCTPAYIYFLLSVIGIIMAIIQNVGNNRIYSLGAMSVPVPNTILVFIVKIVAILFWTWILNMMCKDGHKEIAWFLVLLPFVMLLFMVGTMEGFTTKKVLEGYVNSGMPDVGSTPDMKGFVAPVCKGVNMIPNPNFNPKLGPSDTNKSCVLKPL